MILSFPAFLDAFRSRRVGILVDHNATPHQAIVFFAAEHASSSLVNEVLHLSRGTIHVAIGQLRAEGFNLPTMTRSWTEERFGQSTHPRAYISVEARNGVSTGISTKDRATTLRVLGGRVINPKDLVQPGHIFPVNSPPGGVLTRNTLADASLDCVRMTGCTDASAFCSLLNPHGSFARPETIAHEAQQHAIPVTTIEALVQHRLSNESLVTRVAEALLPTMLAGELQAVSYRSKIFAGDHLALIKGSIDGDQPLLTRVQSEATYHDVFDDIDQPKRKYLQQSLQLIGERGRGAIIYVRQSSRGQLREQLANVRSPNPNSSMRQFGIGAQILRDLGVRKIELIRTSQRSFEGIFDFGLSIEKSVFLET